MRSYSFSLELRDVRLEVTVDSWESPDESVGIFGPAATSWELSDALTDEILDWELTDSELDQLQGKFAEAYCDDQSED